MSRQFSLTEIQRNALVLMTRKGGVCPQSSEATKALTFLTANRLVGMGLASYSQRSGVISYRATSRGLDELSRSDIDDKGMKGRLVSNPIDYLANPIDYRVPPWNAFDAWRMGWNAYLYGKQLMGVGGRDGRLQARGYAAAQRHEGKGDPRAVYDAEVAERQALQKNPRLALSEGVVDASATASLQSIKKLAARSQGDLNSAVIAAAHAAKKTGQTYYVYAGNSYMVAVWRSSYRPGDYLDPINNTGKIVFSVTPELVVAKHDVVR